MGRVAHHLEEKERTRDIEIDENVTFSDLLLSEHVLGGLHAAGFWRPSPIQLAAIPLGRCGLDLVVQAKSGTGKTCVLAVVALESVSTASPATQVVVVTPTREVAVQVTQVVSTLASDMPDLSTAVFIGGTKVADDRAKLKKCQVVVGTPGRLTQLVTLGYLQLCSVRLLVLDEADHLLDGDFLKPVTELAKALPLNKQVLCLSATFSDSATVQAERLMRSPSHVRLDRESPTLLGVNQLVRHLPAGNSSHLRHAAKEAELIRLLSHVTFNQCLVFSGSQFRAESVCHRLKAQGWPAAHLTAAQCQTERLAALDALCSHRCRILVATDLAARGLDSAHVNLVVSLDLPLDPATYLHRAGRAGRFGSRGAAVMLVCGPEEWYGIRAIATLANVRLLLTGQKWASHLATKKVEGWRRAGQQEQQQQQEKEEEVVVVKGVEESTKEKSEGVKNLEEDELEKTEEERKIMDESKERKEEKVTRLEEVEHLTEEEARTWLKAHKPHRKEPRQKETRKENGAVNQENPKNSTKRDCASASNGVEREARHETDAQNPTNHAVKEKKVKKKQQPSSGLPNHRDEGSREEKQEEESNRSDRSAKQEENHSKNKFNTPSHTAGIGKEQIGAGKHNQKQENSTGNQTNKPENNMDTKAEVMSLVSRVWHRPAPVTMSYPHLLSQCTALYNTSPPAPDDIQVKVPPWPVKVEPSEKELAALERYVDGVQEEIRERNQMPDGVSFDALAVLQAVTEGRDASVLLKEATQQAMCVQSPHTPTISSTPHSIHHTDHSSTDTTDHSIHTPPKDTKQLSSSKEQKKKAPSPHNTDLSSPSSSDTEQTSSPLNHKLSFHPSKHTRHPSVTLNKTTPSPRNPLYTTTGARPKESKQARKNKQQQYSKESEPVYESIYYQDNQYENPSNQNYNDNYQGFNQWYPDYGQGFHDYHDQMYTGYNYGYQDYNQAYTTYDPRCHQTYNPGYQYETEHSYYPYTTPTTSYPHTPHGYAHSPQVDAYVKSACKFASMMEYVRTMGRVSMHVAQDYHSRRQKWHEHQ